MKRPSAPDPTDRLFPLVGRRAVCPPLGQPEGPASCQPGCEHRPVRLLARPAVGDLRRYGAGDPVRLVGTALRHQLRRRHAGRRDGGHHRPDGSRGRHIRACARGTPAGAGALSPALSGPAAGGHRRLPDRRHLQPLRLVRDHADLVLRPAGSRWEEGPARRRRQIRDAEPHRDDLLPDDRRLPLRADRDAQHGRPRPDPAYRREPGAGDDAGDPFPGDLRRQGGGVPDVLTGCPRPTTRPPRRWSRSLRPC